jgi:hypothetical protein
MIRSLLPLRFIPAMLLATVALALTVAATLGDRVPCDSPTVALAQCRCNGELYDFSVLRNTDPM